MVLRGQGDSPVRVCEPFKKLEAAARFELHYGRRNRVGKGTGSSRSVSKDEVEILSKIIGSDRKEYSSLRQDSRNEMLLSIQKASGCSSSSNSQGFAAFNEPDHGNVAGSVSPQELRQRALEERKLYKVLKAEGKSAGALNRSSEEKSLRDRLMLWRFHCVEIARKGCLLTV